MSLHELRFVAFSGLAFCWFAAGASGAGPVVPEAGARRLLHELPVRFEPNVGQWDSRVRYCARTTDYNLFLMPREAVLAFPASKEKRGGEVRIGLLGSNASPAIRGTDAFPSRANYFLGNRPKGWRTAVAQYGRVRYEGVYPGIDVVYYGTGRQLEYDFVVRPGADPGRIRLKFSGADRVSLTEGGDLLLESAGRELTQKKPTVYQEGRAGERREVAARYRLLGKNVAGIELGDYDRSQAVTIDPVLVYSSFLGGSGADSVTGIEVDAAGMVYVAGFVGDAAIPATWNAFQTEAGGSTDIFVAKFDPARTGAEALVYFTYIGGSGSDVPTAMAVDNAGHVYLTGSTNSPNFPLGGNAFQTGLAASTETEIGTEPVPDAFVLKLDTNGSGPYALVYSTYLGGDGKDEGAGVDVDAAGNIYVVGTTRSTNFPLTASAHQNGKWEQQDAFVTKIAPDAEDSLAYSTYFGGDSDDWGRSIAVGPDGKVYVAAQTVSPIFGLAGHPYRDSLQGAGDIILAEMDLTKSGDDSLVYRTYIGGSGEDDVHKIAVAGDGKVVLTGYTLSTDFPTTPDALQGALAGNADAFVMEFEIAPPTGRLVYSTYFGGSGGDVAYDAKVGPDGDIYLTGYTLSADFPVTQGALQAFYGGGVDVFVTRMNPASGLLSSTYLGQGGIYVGNSVAVSGEGRIYVGGYAVTSDLPITANSYQASRGGGSTDGFLFVVDPK